MGTAERHVVPYADGWAVKRDGRVSSVHATMEQARARAGEVVNQLGGGVIVLHKKTGSLKKERVAPTDLYVG